MQINATELAKMLLTAHAPQKEGEMLNMDVPLRPLSAEPYSQMRPFLDIPLQRVRIRAGRFVSGPDTWLAWVIEI